MSFFVTKSAKDAGIINPVVAIYTGINGRADSKVYDAYVATAIARLPNIKEDAPRKPEFIGYRTLYETLGYPNIKTAGERLVDVTEKKGFGRFGPLVDSYNLVALNNAEGLGCHDVSDLPKDFDLVFKRALGIEKIHVKPDKTKKITPGDLTYGVNIGGSYVPFAQLGKSDIDNASRRVGENTQAMLLTAIGNGATSQEYNIKVCEDVLNNLRLSSPEAEMELRVGVFVEDHEVGL